MGFRIISIIFYNKLIVLISSIDQRFSNLIFIVHPGKKIEFCRTPNKVRSKTTCERDIPLQLTTPSFNHWLNRVLVIGRKF